MRTNGCRARRMPSVRATTASAGGITWVSGSRTACRTRTSGSRKASTATSGRSGRNGTGGGRGEVQQAPAGLSPGARGRERPGRSGRRNGTTSERQASRRWATPSARGSRRTTSRATRDEATLATSRPAAIVSASDGPEPVVAATSGNTRAASSESATTALPLTTRSSISGWPDGDRLTPTPNVAYRFSIVSMIDNHSGRRRWRSVT